jgi:hypothetical protein
VTRTQARATNTLEIIVERIDYDNESEDGEDWLLLFGNLFGACIPRELCCQCFFVFLIVFITLHVVQLL